MNDYDGPVRDYLAYCKRAAAELKLQGSVLDPKYHPTADGAVKMIPHAGDLTEAKKIRHAFRDLTERPPGAPGTAETTERTQ